jgi:hypothetical protein
MVLLAREGQKRLFLSHLLLLHYGEDDIAVRGGLALVDGYRAPPVMEAPLLVHGEEEKEGYPPWWLLLTFPLTHSLSLLLLL